MKVKRRGDKHLDGRDWREYNERLVARGEAHVSLDFLKSRKRDVGRLNRKKVGRPYTYPGSLMTFTGYLHARCSGWTSLGGYKAS